VPWAWPVRLAKIPVIISSTYSIHEILIALFSVSLFLVIMLVGGVLWFKRWEGRKVYD
jgi:ABC-2 type transport system permease protein